MKDGHVSELLDALTRSYDDRTGDWDSVLHDARRSGSRRRPVRVGLVLAVAAAAAVAALAWPFQAEQGGVLERALAAIGEGPVLHVVLRGEWGGTLVDLSTGGRTPVHGEHEVWYDTERGLVHWVARLGDAVQHERVYEPKEPPAELAALGREYRQALEAGTARVAGEGEVDREPVLWITIRSELLPGTDGRDSEFAQQVAVSRRTFEPVALRETLDGKPGPRTLRRVLELELLPAGAGDFTSSESESLEGRAFSQGREPIALEQAAATLGRTPLWLGREHAGLPLARAFRETTRSGRQRETRLTGADAEAAQACAKLEGRAAGRCFRELGLGSVAVREEGVYASGPVVWAEEQTALVLFYGTLGDDRSTYRKDLVPLFDRPHVTVVQSAESPRFRPGGGEFVPPAGSLFVAAGARTGFLHVDGVHLSIEAADEESVLAAARALAPMPR